MCAHRAIGGIGPKLPPIDLSPNAWPKWSVLFIKFARNIHTEKSAVESFLEGIGRE